VSVDHYENFPVASLLCPPRLRPPIEAIYRFARTADDIADEGDASAARRLADLDAYRRELNACLAGVETPAPRWSQVFGPLARQAQAFALPARPLHDLLDAFEQDVHNPPYRDRAALLDYCSRSAAPIGRLLLHLYGIDDGVSLRRSDAVCSALQLINFWQDLSVDTPRGRHYVPLEDLAAHGLDHAALATGIDTASSRSLVHSLCDWAEAVMHEGAPLATSLPGRAGLELRAVVQGGLLVLHKIRRLDHAVLRRRVSLGAADLPVLAWKALRMTSTRARASAATR
jgi:hydroxysqualene synthase